jgi:hypothetical protein
MANSLAHVHRRIGTAALGLCALAACHSEPTAAAPPHDAGSANLADADASGEPAFCARPGEDAVRDVFCAAAPPTIGSLHDLQNALHLLPPSWATGGAASDADFGNAARYFVVLGHSTALASHVVSPINPRLFLIGDTATLTFQRGVQRIELVTLARDKRAYVLYLVSFQRACDATPDGCSPAERYTPRIESDWTHYEIQDDEELKNTALDCRQCHQRASDAPSLLMREINGPWTHFFEPVPTQPQPHEPPGGRDLTADYVRAKGNELYGGVAIDLVPVSAALDLETAVGEAQPLVFQSETIENERFPYGPDGYVSEAEPSPTWERGYAAFKRGEQLALPYFDARGTDPQKQAALTEAYSRYRAGSISAEELPDLADIFPDDPHTLAQVGLQTEPDATPAEALIQACGTCHNGVLDQSISRARFNIDLARMDRVELERAIERIQLARTAAGAMPPPEARQIDPNVVDRLIDYLRQDPRAADFDPQLEQAAQLGMTGGGRL